MESVRIDIRASTAAADFAVPNGERSRDIHVVADVTDLFNVIGTVRDYLAGVLGRGRVEIWKQRVFPRLLGVFDRQL